MDPMTMLAIAQGVVGGAATIYNMFATGSQLDQAQSRLQTQQGIVQQQYRNSMAGLATQTANERENLDIGTGRLGANLAENGVLGPMSGTVQTGAAAEGSNNIDMQFADKSTQLNLGYQETMNKLNDAGQDISLKQSQLGMDGIAGLAGVGLSAAATMVKAGFGQTSTPDDSFKWGTPGASNLDYAHMGPNGPMGTGYSDAGYAAFRQTLPSEYLNLFG